MEREFVLAAQQQRNNSNNSILFIKRLQRFKTTATLSGSCRSNDKSFIILIGLNAFLPKPNNKRGLKT
jgi:hypothetical protein